MATSTPSNPYVTAFREIQLERERIGFAIHLSVYIAVNALIVFLNFAYTPWIIWFVFPLVGWGVGLIAHFFGAYYIAPARLREAELESLARAEGANLPRAGH